MSTWNHSVPISIVLKAVSWLNVILMDGERKSVEPMSEKI
jgi:hypothetical protein